MEWNQSALSHLEAILQRIHANLSDAEESKNPTESVGQLQKAFDFFSQVDRFIDSAAAGLVDGEELPDYEVSDLSQVIRNQVAALAKQRFGLERPLVN
jgi:hypothetical protein